MHILNLPPIVGHSILFPNLAVEIRHKTQNNLITLFVCILRCPKNGFLYRTHVGLRSWKSFPHKNPQSF